MDHYTKLYSKCLIDFAERAIRRMRDDNGSIIFISSPGCNITQTVKPGYDMPGKPFFTFLFLIFIFSSIPEFLNYFDFLKGSESLLENLLYDTTLKIFSQEESMPTQ